MTWWDNHILTILREHGPLTTRQLRDRLAPDIGVSAMAAKVALLRRACPGVIVSGVGRYSRGHGVAA